MGMKAQETATVLFNMPKEGKRSHFSYHYVDTFEITGHRFYKNEYPKVDDVVMVKVEK